MSRFSCFVLSIAGSFLLESSALAVTWVRVNGELDIVADDGAPLVITLDSTPGGEVILAPVLDSNGNGLYEPQIDRIMTNWLRVDGSSKDEDPSPGLIQETLVPRVGSEIDQPILFLATEVGSGTEAHCRATFRNPPAAQGIRGSVVDRDGAPAAGKVVWAAFSWNIDLQDPSDSEWLWAARSDPEGNFVIYLPRGGIYMVGTGEGKASVQYIPVTEGSFVEGIQVVVPPDEEECFEGTVTLSGTVKDEQGRPLPFVELDFEAGEKRPLPFTDLQGSFEIRTIPGRKSTELELKGYAQDENYEFDITQDILLDLRMHRVEFRLEGIVVDDSTGEPIPGIEVGQVRVGDPFFEDEDETDQLGRYLIWVEKGPTWLYAETDQRPYESFEMTVDISGNTVRQIRLTPMAATVAGTVTDNHGFEVIGTYVEAINLTSWELASPSTLAGTDGSYSLPLTPGALYNIVFLRPGWDTKIELVTAPPAGETHPLDVVLQYISGRPLVSGGLVDPPSGDPGTSFTFEVVYTDSDNDPPSVIQVTIDGTNHNMSPADPGDTSYDDGARYVFSIGLGAGAHSFSFSATDSQGVSAWVGPGEPGEHRGPCVNFIPLPNDRCADAQAVEPGDSWTVDLASATREAAEPEGCYDSIYHTVWYRFAGTETGLVTVTAWPEAWSWTPAIDIFEDECPRGMCWDGEVMEGAPTLRSIKILEALPDGEVTKGWVVGDGGFIYSDDGPQESDTTADLHTIFALDADLAWVAGGDGTILHTTDGGATWTPQASGVTSDLHGIHFFDPDRGLVAGDSGTILGTVDGGETWTPLDSGVTVALRGVRCLGAGQGLAVGDGGAILEMTDGLHWAGKASPTSEDLHAIDFADGQVGWIAGGRGAVLRTSDGGDTWSLQTTGITTTLYAIEAVDAQNAWAAGAGGVILRTTDGGQSWIAQETGVSTDIFTLSFVGGEQGFAAGKDGLILGLGACEPDRTTCGTHNSSFVVEAGMDRLIRIGSLSSSAGPVDIDFEFIPCSGPPPNDDCASALRIGSLPYNEELDLRCGGREEEEPWECWSSQSTAWYSFTASQSGILRIEAISIDGWSYAEIVLFQGSCGALTSVSCRSETLDRPVNPGDSFLIRIGTYYRPEAIFDLKVSLMSSCFSESSMTSWPEGDVVRGDTIAYGISVMNGCSMDLTNVTVKVTLPESTSYVPGSARLDGAPIEPLGDEFTIPMVPAYSMVNLEYKARVIGEAPTGASLLSRALVNGTISLSVTSTVIDSPEPPPNDDCLAAKIVPSLPFSESVDLRGATIEPGDPPSPMLEGWVPMHTIWYEYTAAETGWLSFNGGSGIPYLVLDVFRGSCSDLDYRASSVGSTQPVFLSAGGKFLLRVGTPNPAGGTAEVNFGFTPATCLASSSMTVQPPGNAPWDRELTYTITITNLCDVSATGVEVTDPTPAWATYVPSSTTLNGTPVSDVDGRSPLEGGLLLGTIASEASAVVKFRVIVKSGTTHGSTIENRATVEAEGPSHASIELQAINIAVNPIFLPMNDDCANAKTIPSIPYSDTMDMTFATVGPREEWPGVWYSYSPAEDEVVTIATNESGNWTKVDVIEGTCSSPRWGGFWYIGRLNLHLYGGRTYRFCFYSTFGAGGTLVLSIEPSTCMELTLNPSPAECAVPWDAITYKMVLQNLCQEPASGATMAAHVPSGTAYVPGSTLLNGSPVDDLPDGRTPLEEGLVVGSPEADPGTIYSSLWYACTVEFTVRVLEGAPEGSVVTCSALAAWSSPTAESETLSADTTVCSGGERPPNDDCGGAQVIAAFPLSEVLDLSGASIESDEPGGWWQEAWGEGTRHTVWYSYTPGQRGLLRISVEGGGFTPTLDVFTGSCGSPSLLEPRWEEWETKLKISFPVSPGETYLIRVGSLGSTAGPATVDMVWLTQDLAVTKVIPPDDGVIAGTTVDVTYEVTNQSDFPTDVCCWVDTIYLAGPSGLGLGESPNPMVLPSHGSYSNTVQVYLPRRLEGTFQIEVLTDRHNVVFETDESNNHGYSPPFLIVTGDRPDLEVETIDVPPEAFFPRNFTVAWSVKNAGSSDAMGDWRGWRDEVYLSRNEDRSIDGDIRFGLRDHDQPLATGQSYQEEITDILPAQAKDWGTLFVKVRTDALDAVWEPLFGGEANNIAVSPPVTVISQALCDLEIRSVNPPGHAFTGHLIQVTWSGGKTGGLSTDHPLYWKDGIYLSGDELLDPGDHLLGKIGRGTTLDGDGRIVLPDYTAGASFMVPPDLPAGSYYIIVCVDVDDDVFEGPSEDNNCLAEGPFRIDHTTMDLAVAAPCPGGPALPSSAPAERPIALSFQVKNVGQIATPFPYWHDGVYFSADDALDYRDVALALEWHYSILEPQASYCVRCTAWVPRVAPGNYHLLFATEVDWYSHSLYPIEGTEGAGNNLLSVPFTVLEDAPDLMVTDIRCAGTAVPAVPFHIEWTVKNDGNLGTQEGFWTDCLYLSDNISGHKIGARSRTSPLDSGASYTAAIDVDLPLNLSGMFSVSVQTNCDGKVYESNVQNNVLVKDTQLYVAAFPGANLVLGDVAPSTDPVVSGQAICVSFSVANSGQGPTSAASWLDAVYLSRDWYLDTSSDIYVGNLEHKGALGPSEGYTGSVCLDVPFGLSGPYYVFVVADSLGSVFENGALEDSRGRAPETVEIVLPDPSDLVVEEVVVPPSGFLGETAHLEWRTRNAGDHTIQGHYYDVIYLSVDGTWDLGDRLIGRFETSLAAPLEPGMAQTTIVDARIPGVKPGSYLLLVRVDANNQIPEVDEGNNVGASAGTIGLSAREMLILDDPPGEFAIQADEEKYFEMSAPAGETIKVHVDRDDLSAWIELYASFEDAPAPGWSDFRSSAPGQSHQSLKIPETKAGKYYVLVRGAPGTFRIEAKVIPFLVDSVMPMEVGDEGRVTLTVGGSRFAEGVTLHLVGPGGARIPVRHVDVKSTIELRARFLLQNPPHGLYDLVAESPGAGVGTETRLPGAVVIEALKPATIAIESGEPPALREGLSGGTWDWVVANRGNVDADYLFLFEAIETGEGRELIDVGSRAGLPGSAVRDGAFHLSALIRSLAPGERASLSTTLRAGAGVGEMPVGLGIALLSTERFLHFEEEVAEAARVSALADPGILIPDQRNALLDLAQDPAGWRSRWLSKLADAVLADREEVLDRRAGSSMGSVECPAPRSDRERPAIGEESPERLCREWLARLLETGADALGGFATRPPESALVQLGCALDRIIRCTSFTFWAVKRSEDPNEKTGSEGVGEERYVGKDTPIRYRIYFENVASASAPAAMVKIEDGIDENLNPGSFKLESIAFGGTVIHLEEEISLQKRIDLVTRDGVFLDIVAGVNSSDREAFWILRSIDPSTGEVPRGALLGFLPPNDSQGSGLGWVEYSLRPNRTAKTGVKIKNEAMVMFDVNEPILTRPVIHTLDADAPSSAITPLPEESVDPRIPLFWSGQDAGEGSGLAGYTVYVSRDGGPFEPFLLNTAETSAIYVGEAGHCYAFSTCAVDRTGNREEAPDPQNPDVKICVLGGFRRGDVDGDGFVNITDVIAFLGWNFRGDPANLDCPDSSDADDSGELTVTDAIVMLGWQFRGDPPVLPPPGADGCGPDDKPDELEECGYPSESCAP